MPDTYTLIFHIKEILTGTVVFSVHVVPVLSLHAIQSPEVSSCNCSDVSYDLSLSGVELIAVTKPPKS